MLVGTVLSLVFWAIGLPYWILLGAFAGVVEIVPVIGPLVAGALAVGVGLTVSWQTALAAGLAVLVVRLLEDYLVIPRVLGDAVGLTPLVVLVAVTACGLLFGGFAVILAIPLAAVIATLIDVIVRDKDPAEEEVPAVIFSAKDAEAETGQTRGRRARAAEPGPGGARPGFAPAAEDEAAEGEAEPEGAERERADGDRLPRHREPVPAAERLLLLGRQRLAAALLAQRAAGPQPEVEVVEDLRGVAPRLVSEPVSAHGRTV